MSQGQSPGEGRTPRGRRPRPSREMRERAEQMAELLDHAAAKPARSRRRGRAAMAGPVLGMSALAIGGVGVVLGLDPGAAGQELSLPALHDIPGATDAPGSGGQEHADPDRPVATPGVDATTGITSLADGAPRPAALPGPPPAPRPASDAPGRDPGQPAGRHSSDARGPAAPVTVTASPSSSPSSSPLPSSPAPARPSTSPRSGHQGTRPSSGPPPTTTPSRSTGLTGGLPRSDSRASAPSVPLPAPGSSSSSTSSSGSAAGSTHPDRTGSRHGH